MVQQLPKPRRDWQPVQPLHQSQPGVAMPFLKVVTPPVPSSPIAPAPSVTGPTPTGWYLPAAYPEGQIPEARQHERVMVFIDGANLFYATLKLNLELDYTKLLRRLIDGRQLIRAYFYTGVDPSNEKQQGFLLWLRRNGYRVITKTLTQFPDGTKKANLDVEIAVDMLMLAKTCDTLILLSGDGDLTYVLDRIAYEGKRVEVISLRSMTSDRLINAADCYTDLDEIKGDVQRDYSVSQPNGVHNPL